MLEIVTKFIYIIFFSSHPVLLKVGIFSRFGMAFVLVLHFHMYDSTVLKSLTFYFFLIYTLPLNGCE